MMKHDVEDCILCFKMLSVVDMKKRADDIHYIHTYILTYYISYFLFDQSPGKWKLSPVNVSINEPMNHI